jgi:hypothetical protein
MSTTTTLQEMVIAAHFQPSMPLTLMDVASWVEEFQGEYPAFQQSPAPPPASLNAAPGAVIGGQAFMIGPVGVDLPRMRLSAINSPYYVLMQTDRIGLGWARRRPLGEPDDYKGFDAMRARWGDFVARFDAWQAKRLGGTSAVHMMELSYVNAIPMTVRGERRRLSQLFRFVQPTRPVNAFGVNWAELIPEHPGGARVQAQAGLGQHVQTGESVFSFSYGGMAAVQGGAGSEAAFAALDTLHARILDIHTAAIISGDESQ